MAIHAEYALRGAGIAEVFDFLLAVPALETIGTKCLITCQDREIFDFVPTAAAAVCTVVADQ